MRLRVRSLSYIFERGKFTEDELEHAIIELFQMQGYEYTYGEDIHRCFEDILLEDDLRTFLNRKYAIRTSAMWR